MKIDFGSYLLKKVIISLFGLIHALVTLPQDWQPFVKDQTNYYKQQYGNSTKVEGFLTDSIYVRDHKKIYLFNSKSGIPDLCYSKIRKDLMSYDYWLNNPQKIDSLILSNDSLLFIKDNISGIDTFIFMPYSNIGDTWYTRSRITDSRGSGDTISVKIECAEKMINNIFGNPDSVKIFKCTGDPFDTIEFVLSKSYGFIKFIPLNEVMWHYSENSLEPYFELIGYSSPGISQGYKQPDFTDYFHLSAGDKLYWLQFSESQDPRIPKSTSYQADSITFAYISPDSVYYEYKRTDYNESGSITYTGNNYTFHLRKDEGIILENNTSWYGLKYDKFPTNEMFFLEALQITIENTDTITYAQYRLPGIFLDTTECYLHFAADYDMTIGFSTREGQVFQGTYSWGQSYIKLIGSIISGKGYGVTSIPTDLNETIITDYRVYPNPFLDYICVDMHDQQISRIEIIDALGSLAITVESNFGMIDLSSLSKGIYILKITYLNESTNQMKIIKQ